MNFRFPSKQRAWLFDRRAETLHELQILADDEGDDDLAEQLGEQLTELDAKLEVENQKLEAEKHAPTFIDANQYFARRAIAIADGIARRADASMDEAFNPTCIL